jgi:hypothetical protein
MIAQFQRDPDSGPRRPATLRLLDGTSRCFDILPGDVFDWLDFGPFDANRDFADAADRLASLCELALDLGQCVSSCAFALDLCFRASVLRFTAKIPGDSAFSCCLSPCDLSFLAPLTDLAE